MRAIDAGVVIAGRPKTDMASVCFPSIAVLPSGRWLAGARLGPAKSSRTQRVATAWSDDEGETWTGPNLVTPEVKHRGRAGTWRACNVSSSGGNRVIASLCWEDAEDLWKPMFNEATEGIVDMKLFTALSRDGGETWGKPRLVNCGNYQSVPVAITGPTMVLADGTWAAQFEVNKNYDDTTPWQHHSSLVFSRDQGRTWRGVVDTHTDPNRRIFCWDQRIGVMPDGSMLALYWTFDRDAAVYLNIHARHSNDGGKTWGKLWDTGVTGQPARPVGLPDGRIFMAYVDRTSTPTIKARISIDGGKTFPKKSEIEVHKRQMPTQTVKKGSMQDAWAEMSKFSLGLPDTALLANGHVLCVFYTGDNQDNTDMQWARVEV